MDKGSRLPRSARFSVTWAILAAALLLGAGMRFYRLGSVPPGLYHDEAFNGSDAIGILNGNLALFFEANNGREPLFLYVMALFLAIWGRTPFAVRLTAAVLGTLAVPATFLMVRSLFGERVARWSALLFAVLPWPVHLSRIGLRAISMPLITSVALWLWWSGRDRKKGQRVWRVALGGALLGLSLYTYTAARFAPLIVLSFALFKVVVSRERSRRSELLWLALAVLVAMTPLMTYWLRHWEAFLGRMSQVSIFNPEISNGEPWSLLVRNLARAVGLFTCRGDAIPRHNVPLRPLFDPFVSVFFAMGVLLSLVRAKRSASHALALLWTGVMLAPTVLAEDCPHFLRAVGVLPLATVFPALGLEWVREHLQPRKWRHAGSWLVAAVLGIGCVLGAYDYFVRYGGDPELAFWFEADQVQEAVEINRFLGSGWQGEGIAEPKGTLLPDRHVYLAPRMWEDRLTVNFLVASPEQVSILGRDPPVGTDQNLVLVWPHEEMRDSLSVLPHPARIEVWPGPLERGDLDLEARLLYVAFQATRLRAPSAAMARFEEGIELLGWEATAEPDGQTRISLRWRASGPLSRSYTAFTHLVRDGQIVAQEDGIPGYGYFPTAWWEQNDEIVDVRILNAPYDPTREQVVVGWYELDSMRHLRVLDEHSQAGADRLVLK